MAADLRVLLFAADEGGCGLYRVIWPGAALANEGCDVRVVLPGDPGGWQLHGEWIDDPDGTPRLQAVIRPEADVVVLQRPLERPKVEAIPMLQAQGVKVVVEIDDDFATISRRNVAWKSVQPHLSPDKNHEWLQRACDVADLVTVTTPALAARYGRHGRVAILPNYVPARYLDVTREPRDGVFVGWSGSLDTHPDDLQVCGDGVARAVDVAGAQVGVVGTGKGVMKALGLRRPPLACGWKDIMEYPEAMAQIDVGLVPLELTPFNEAKSWLKGLEFASLGVPFVASPTQQYRALAEIGIGQLASSPSQWRRIVSALIRDPDRRADLADQARTVAAQLTIERNCGQWWDAWRGLVNTACAA